MKLGGQVDEITQSTGNAIIDVIGGAYEKNGVCVIITWVWLMLYAIVGQLLLFHDFIKHREIQCFPFVEHLQVIKCGISISDFIKYHRDCRYACLAKHSEISY